MGIRIQHRRLTAAGWVSANPVLAQAELGVEYDTLKVKVGDGVTAWNSLPYLGGSGGGSGTGVPGWPGEQGEPGMFIPGAKGADGAGGGGSGPTEIVLGADFSWSATSTLTSVTGFSFSAAASTWYRIRAEMWFTAIPNGDVLQIQSVLPGSGSPSQQGAVIFLVNATNASVIRRLTAANDSASAINAAGADGLVLCTYDLLMYAGSVGGTYQIKVYKDGAGTSNVKRGSRLTYIAV